MPLETEKSSMRLVFVIGLFLFSFHAFANYGAASFCEEFRPATAPPRFFDQRTGQFAPLPNPPRNPLRCYLIYGAIDWNFDECVNQNTQGLATEVAPNAIFNEQVPRRDCSESEANFVQSCPPRNTRERTQDVIRALTFQSRIERTQLVPNPRCNYSEEQNGMLMVGQGFRRDLSEIVGRNYNVPESSAYYGAEMPRQGGSLCYRGVKQKIETSWLHEFSGTYGYGMTGMLDLGSRISVLGADGVRRGIGESAFKSNLEGWMNQYSHQTYNIPGIDGVVRREGQYQAVSAVTTGHMEAMGFTNMIKPNPEHLMQATDRRGRPRRMTIEGGATGPVIAPGCQHSRAESQANMDLLNSDRVPPGAVVVWSGGRGSGHIETKTHNINPTGETRAGFCSDFCSPAPIQDRCLVGIYIPRRDMRQACRPRGGR